MSIVTALRFNGKMGAVASDEGMWNLRFRRKMHMDRLHRLLDAEVAEALGVEVVYGGSGYSSLHHEVVGKTREELRRLWSERGKDAVKNPPFSTVEDISRIALDVMHGVIRRRIDLRLRFFYGFDTNALNGGRFEVDGEGFDISQESVRDQALKIAQGEEGGRLSRAWFKSRAMVFGYDAERGMTGYYLDPEKSVMCFNYEGWEAFGSGKYASGIVLARFLNRKPLEVRRRGYDAAEGLVTLLDATLTAMETFQETGGNVNFVIIDGSEASPSRRYREVFDDVSRLCCDIVNAWRWGFLARGDAERLIRSLIFEGGSFGDIFHALDGAVSDPAAFRLAWRGYKLDEVPALSASLGRRPGERKDSTGETGRKKGRKRS